MTLRNNFLPLARPHITRSEIRAVSRIMKSGHLTTGPKVTEFEDKIAEYIGKDISAVALNSCTGGLYLSLLTHGIGKGDEVIMPTWTFVACGHTVLWTGAKPVFCDIDESSLNINFRKINSLINSKTKAIMPVHFAGYPCEMEAIMEIAKKHKLIIIEDAAHAIGTKYKGEKIGNFGNLTVFSFYATKNLTCAEGGMVVSRNRKIIDKIRKLSYFGISKEAHNRYERRGTWYYQIQELGYKYNMDSLHAAIGIIQLKKLDKMNTRRRHIADIYKKNLDQRIKFTEEAISNYHTYHLFVIRVNNKIIGRDELIEKLKSRNIATGVHFIPLHKHPYYKALLNKKDFAVADKAYEEVLSIPMFAGMSDSSAYYVVENINDILKRGR